MLKIQEFIIKNGLQAAIDQFHLKVNETEHYVQLNYDQIESPKGIPECDECRGLILDRHTWGVAAQSFYRFYNEHEGHSAKVSLENGELQEKLDGTLITLWFDQYQEKWVVSTRGRIFADGEVGNAAQKAFGGEPKTFADLFWKTAEKYPLFITTMSLTRPANPNGSLVFELFGPENRILTRYEESDIRLIGGRDSDWNELSDIRLDDIAVTLGVKRPKTYYFNTMEDIRAIFEELNPTDEGFVLVDYTTRDASGNFPRTKIKNPRYLALSHALHAGDGELMDAKSIVNLIRIGEIDEVIAYFPEFKDKILQMKQKFLDLGAEIDTAFGLIRSLESRKDYALAAQKYQVPNALYALRDGTVASGFEYLRKMKEENLLALIK